MLGLEGDTMHDASLIEQSRPPSTGEVWEDTRRIARIRPLLKKEYPHAQHELLQHIAELEQSNTGRNMLMGMAAHDLKNPLSAILYGTEFLLEQLSGKLDEKERQLFATVCHASSMMIRIVNDLVDLAGIEAGQLSVELEDVEFMSLVNNSVEANRPRAEKKNITLEVHPAANRVFLCADPARIEQVFNNVIGNAVKYSVPGSCVQVCVRKDQHNAITTVIDQGPGMSAQEMGVLFKPFRTVRRGTCGEKGLGLGLVIARMIVTAHQGRIWVESEEGKGSTFHVSLPRATCANDSSRTYSSC
jgi:signal transduction histidine kinase